MSSQVLAEIKFVDRQACLDISKIDSGVKNKFKWTWLESADEDGVFFSVYVRKLEDAGLAWCTVCKAKINYGSAGKKAFDSHAKTKKHKRFSSDLKTTKLPVAFQTLKSYQAAENPISVPSQSLPTQPVYGQALNVPRPASVTDTCVEKSASALYVSVRDRISQQEALICSFIAEHSLPLSIAPYVVSLAKELSRDPKALSKLSMERTTVAYKLKEGMSEVLHKRLVMKMKM